MKKMIIITVLVLIIGMVLSGCKGVHPPLLPTTIETDKGKLILALDGNGESRTLVPNIDMNIASYAVTGSGPDGATFSINTTETILLQENLTFGSWTLMVEGLNSSATVIARGAIIIEIIPGQTTTAHVSVELLSGFGTLDLDISWPAADIFLPTIQASLMPLSGTERTLNTTTLNKDTGMASITINDVAAGFYTLSIRLTDRGQLVMGSVEMVWIAEGAVTAGNFSYTNVNDAQGSMDITITPEMTNPLNVTMNGVFSTIREDQTISLSVETPGYNENCLYFWYLNGQCIDTGETCTFTGLDVGAGFCRLDVTVISADYTRGGSASAQFTVTEGIWESKITSFSFMAADNAGLDTDVTGTINGNDITATVPYGVDISNLIANFNASVGASIAVGLTNQISGITSNNYSGDLTFTVTAHNGLIENYIIKITEEIPSSEKEFITFTITKAKNPSLASDINGAISGNNISLNVPFGTDLTNLIATFSTTGDSVSVGNSVQTSGYTANDFTSEVIYTVNAEDGGIQNYSVTLNTSINNITKIGEALRHEYGTVGYVGDLFISNNYCYLSCSRGLKIFDITNESSPEFIGEVTLMNTESVYVKGNYAYMASVQGVYIIDISDPMNPYYKRLISSPGAADVYVSGDYAYVACKNSGLKIFNVSNLDRPTYTGQYDTDGYSVDVTIKEDYAYVADSNGGMKIIDISNPENPKLASTYNTSSYGNCNAVFIKNNYAYIMDPNSSGLTILDISNPKNPLKIESISSTNGDGLTVKNNYAYVCNNYRGFSIIDITNPRSPSQTGFIELFGLALNVSIVGDYAYVANNTSGLTIIDIKNPANPIIIETYNTCKSGDDIHISNQYAYVADSISGFKIFDISIPSNPLLVGKYSFSATGVTTKGNYAYVVGSEGLYIFDISIPSSPSFSGTIRNDSLSLASNISITNNHAYVINRNGQQDYFLNIFDISNPINLVLKGSYKFNDVPLDLYVSDSFALIATVNGLLIVDIRHPETPVLAGTFETERSKGVYARGTKAFITDNYGFKIIDISNPFNPFLSGSYEISNLMKVYVIDDYAFIANKSEGFNIFDISNPSSPSLVNVPTDISGPAHKILINGNYAYLLNKDPLSIPQKPGIRVYKIQ